jgi:hypothetical protein
MPEGASDSENQGTAPIKIRTRAFRAARRGYRVATVQFHFLEQDGVALDRARFEAHYGLKSDVALGPKSATGDIAR